MISVCCKKVIMKNISKIKRERKLKNGEHKRSKQKYRRELKDKRKKDKQY